MDDEVMSEMRKLRPCPKCGSDNVKHRDFQTIFFFGARSYYVACKDCRHTSRWCPSRARAATDWDISADIHEANTLAQYPDHFPEYAAPCVMPDHENEPAPSTPKDNIMPQDEQTEPDATEKAEAFTPPGPITIQPPYFLPGEPGQKGATREEILKHLAELFAHSDGHVLHAEFPSCSGGLKVCASTARELQGADGSQLTAELARKIASTSSYRYDGPRIRLEIETPDRDDG